MSRSKKINYQAFSETGEKVEKIGNQSEETVEVAEISILLRSISISDELNNIA